MGYWHKLYHPEIFQGTLQKKNYFEGWYYKIVSDDEDLALAIIPGVSIGREGPDHAFIQVLDGIRAISEYHRFDIVDFKADNRVLDVTIGNNHFTESRMVLDLPELKADLDFSNHHPIPTHIFSPGIMGWYSFTPFMQCYHGVVSMHHWIQGSLVFNGNTHTIESGIGYLEKDWGTSFPKCWIWTHCNHFKGETASLMASVAHIPWMGTSFIGFIVSFLFRGEIKFFATYNGSRMKASIVEKQVRLSFKRKKEELRIICNPGPGAELLSPIEGMMNGKVNESLQATCHIEYQQDDRVHHLNGTTTGLEVAGEVDVLLTDHWRK